jgi:hypothetical protein
MLWNWGTYPLCFNTLAPFVIVSPKEKNGMSSIKPCLYSITNRFWPKPWIANILLMLVSMLLRLVKIGYHMILTTRNSYLAFWPNDTCKKSPNLQNCYGKLIIRNGPIVLMSSAASYMKSYMTRDWIDGISIYSLDPSLYFLQAILWR